MTKLKNLQDIIDLEIKSVREVVSNSKKKWSEIEERIIAERKAPSLSAYLIYEYQFNNKSINYLAKELGINDRNSLKNIMIKMGIPILNRSESFAGKRHPLYGKPISERHKSILTKSRQDAGFYESKEYREKMSKSLSGEKNPRYKANISEGTRRKLSTLARERWRDTEYADRMLVIKKNLLPTHHGYRRDINNNSKSMMEANLERAIIQSGREYERDVPFHLKDGSNECTIFIDFSTQRGGKKVYYEIMAHPFEESRGYDKLKLLAKQEPNIRIKVVTGYNSYYKCREYFVDEIQRGNFQVVPYSKYEEHFMPKVNANSLIREVHQGIVREEGDSGACGYKSALRKKVEEHNFDAKKFSELYISANPPKFCGWEMTGFNLTTHPNLFNPENK